MQIATFEDWGVIHVACKQCTLTIHQLISQRQPLEFGNFISEGSSKFLDGYGVNITL